jgi:hypothetical protein
MIKNLLIIYVIGVAISGAVLEHYDFRCSWFEFKTNVYSRRTFYFGIFLALAWPALLALALLALAFLLATGSICLIVLAIFGEQGNFKQSKYS